MSKKREKNNKSQTKAGLMSKNSGGQTEAPQETAKDKNDQLDNLPKMSKQKAEGSRESEGLH